MYDTIDDWIAREALGFSCDSPGAFSAAVGKMVAGLGDAVELLGLGEALHGGEEILVLRNRLFQRLVETHGYSAIAVESSFPRAWVVNEYVAGRGADSFEALQDRGFSHSFGRLEANRELVEWMRQYNADSGQRVPLRFYGFDCPTEMCGTDSPRQLLHFVLDYLTGLDCAGLSERRQRIDELLGPDSAWDNPAVAMDPSQSIGLSPSATSLRIETEDLITELRLQRPTWVAASDEGRFVEALQYASLARQMLNYHAALAKATKDRLVVLLGIRDAAMADNLAYAVSQERERGKVLAFAHNMHLQRGMARWQLGPEALAWWPAGAHVHAMLGPRYAVVGTALGISADNGLSSPEPGTLEARLSGTPGPARFIPTHRGQGLPTSAIAELPTRSGSRRNPTYFALTPQSFTDFDGLISLDSTTYSRGGPPLPEA